jgi:hypothetical protein
MKPVAWLNKDDSSLSFKNHGGGWQPLYTHPADLTDDELIELFANHKFSEEGVAKFAKAILKKAQEK